MKKQFNAAEKAYEKHDFSILFHYFTFMKMEITVCALIIYFKERLGSRILKYCVAYIAIKALNKYKVFLSLISLKK